MIRNITEIDLKELKKIHEQFFDKEFSFDDFVHNSITNFLITDDKDNDIVSACSIRPIAEMVAISNLNKSPRMRVNALHDILQVAQYTLSHSPQFRQLHVFVQDGKWESQLIRSGFKKTIGNALYINV